MPQQRLATLVDMEVMVVTAAAMVAMEVMDMERGLLMPRL
jgi:hypothetical protein